MRTLGALGTGCLVLPRLLPASIVGFSRPEYGIRLVGSIIRCMVFVDALGAVEA